MVGFTVTLSALLEDVGLLFIPEGIFSTHYGMMCWELVPAVGMNHSLHFQLSVLTWVKGLSLVTVAVGEVIVLYSINQVILRPLGQPNGSFWSLQIS